MSKKEEKKKVLKKKDTINVSFENPLEVKSGTSSIEIKRNSKGNTEFIIKVYGNNLPNAKNEASKVFDQLNKKYPS